MTEIFKTVLYLSILGAAAVILLLVLKPITAKRFSARWQYFVWLFAAISMVVPFWRSRRALFNVFYNLTELFFRNSFRGIKGMTQAAVGPCCGVYFFSVSANLESKTFGNAAQRYHYMLV